MTKQDLDITEVWGVFLTAFGITLSDVETTLKIVSLILAIVFTLYKFRKEIRKDNRDARKK